MKHIKIFDTTLRDGEQVPGCQLNHNEKIEVALALEDLGVDIIEAGFPISSPGDFASVAAIAKAVKNSTVAGLARGVEKDIDAVYESVKNAESPRIHTFLPISDIQIENILKKTREQVLQRVRDTVAYAKKYVSDVEWSGMDASRADINFLIECCRAAIEAGATTINVPDTVGYATPAEHGWMIKRLCEAIPEFNNDIALSVHVHNDLGLATANSLEGVINGATQVECTINGVGERAGNTALEEIVMVLKTRYKKDYSTNIKSQKIAITSKMISNMMNMPVQKNKAIVGAHAFAHSSGIHQDGILKKRDTFEVMNPTDVGVDISSLVLTARSGRAALGHHLQRLGYKVTPEEMAVVYEGFVKLADKKKELSDADLHELMGNKEAAKDKLQLTLLEVVCGFPLKPMATVRINIDGVEHESSQSGNGPVDAAYKCINEILKKIGVKEPVLEEYLVQAVTHGIDDQGRVNVNINYDGKSSNGRAADTDVIVASAKAYLNAVSKVISAPVTATQEVTL